MLIIGELINTSRKIINEAVEKKMLIILRKLHKMKLRQGLTILM